MEKEIWRQITLPKVSHGDKSNMYSSSDCIQFFFHFYQNGENEGGGRQRCRGKRKRQKHINFFFFEDTKIIFISGSMRGQVREIILVTISVLHGSMQQQ
jgi:hypothetical protein